MARRRVARKLTKSVKEFAAVRAEAALVVGHSAPFSGASCPRRWLMRARAKTRTSDAPTGKGEVSK
jgi:hypothetical protein